MYGGPFHLVFAVRAPKKRCDYFWPDFWPENAFSPFSYTGGLLVCKNEKLNCFDIQSVVEASSFRLNHNVTLESKENYPRHTKIVQNSLGFMPEVKPLHKPRGDLVLCALQFEGSWKLSQYHFSSFSEKFNQFQASYLSNNTLPCLNREKFCFYIFAPNAQNPQILSFWRYSVFAAILIEIRTVFSNFSNPKCF